MVELVRSEEWTIEVYSYRNSIPQFPTMTKKEICELVYIMAKNIPCFCHTSNFLSTTLRYLSVKVSIICDQDPILINF